MSPAEIDRIINALLQGRSKTTSDYHAGERRSWYYDRATERFTNRTQSLSHDGTFQRYTEEELRTQLVEQPYGWWADIVD
jgi:hypothetical protein